LLIESKSTILVNVLVFFYYAWMFANMPAQSSMATFYLVLMLFVIVMSVINRYMVQKEDESTVKTGFKFPWLQALVGVVIFGAMLLISNLNQGAAIIGVPRLFAASGLASMATLNLINISILGFVENRAFFSLYNIIKKAGLTAFLGFFLRLIPVLGSMVMWILNAFAIILPFVVVCLGFAVFHLYAYASQAVKLVFAFFAFSIFLASYEFFKYVKNTAQPSVAADVAHYLWNMSFAVWSFMIVGV